MDCPSSSRCDPFVAEDALVGQKQHPLVATDVKNDRGILFLCRQKSPSSSSVVVSRSKSVVVVDGDEINT